VNSFAESVSGQFSKNLFLEISVCPRVLAIISVFADTLGLMLLPKLAALFGGCVCNLELFGPSLYCTELSEQMLTEMILELDWLFYAHRPVLGCPSYASVL